METKSSVPGSKPNPETNTYKHVDEFIDTHPCALLKSHEPNINYARFVLNNFRLPSHLQIDFEQFTQRFKLFCYCSLEEYQGRKLEVVFASRMGWIGLREINSTHHSYENSVPISKCYGWTPD